MLSAWQSKLVRVTQMGWEEVRVRAGQEFRKRRDLLMHRMGKRHGPMALNADSAPPGRFLFSASERSGSECSARAALLRKHLPDEASEILREADAICGHRFRLLGYENLDYGDPIDWHLDSVHAKRAPLDPWFKIPFLDFAAVGDHKVIWELNRHQHLVALAKARLLSGDEKYIRELMAQWHSWIKANPYPLGINWGSTLEVAFRSLSWIWVDQLLAGTAEYGKFRAELVPALAFHGHYIERYLSSYFSPNTHLLGEAVALLFLGTLYPQIPRAARWTESAWKIVLHEAERQVRRDGVYFEQSLYYHVYALDFFLYARLLRARNGMEIPKAYDAVLGRMLDVVAALAQAGPAEGFGDDDGGRLWNPRRNHTEQMTDPLALGAMMYSREFFAARLTEEAIWLFGNQSVDVLSQQPQKPRQEPGAAAYSIAFPNGGLYVLADSEPHAQEVVVDGGPQGEGRSGHGHADALSLRLTMDGRRWLVDAGSGVYVSKDSTDRDRFRGTGAHNTLRVDGMDQAVADGPFSWTHLPTTHPENWIAGKSFAYFVGSHNGYARLRDPVLHRRHILKVAGSVCLVRDIALGRAEHELEIRWHLAHDLDVRAVGPGRVEVSRAGAQPGESRLSLMVPEETVWQRATQVTQTLLSPAYGALQSAPLVRCHARVMLPAETATVLVPGKVARRGDAPLMEPRLAAMTQAAVQLYELDDGNESHRFFFALGDTAWSFGPWSSDAQALYCRVENQKLAQLVVIDGTRVAWQGRPLLQSATRPQVFEWRRQGVVTNAAAGEFTVTAWFEALAGGSCSLPANLNHDSSSQASPPYAGKH